MPEFGKRFGEIKSEEDVCAFLTMLAGLVRPDGVVNREATAAVEFLKKGGTAAKLKALVLDYRLKCTCIDHGCDLCTQAWNLAGDVALTPNS